MNIEQEILAILDEALSLRGRANQFSRDTVLLGAIPELDSMAVMAIINLLEERFGMAIGDDEIEGATFATVGALADFARGKVEGCRLLSRQPFFLPPKDGQRFCIFTPARGPAAKGAILYLHPFAEELNKTRHIVAEQVRLLAATGYSTLQIDLKGCGDSSHDFGDATWADWLDDVRLAISWLQGQTMAPLWLWGLRASALLATEAGRYLGLPCNYLFWHPFVSGETAMQQLLRLAAAAEWLSSEGRGAVERCKAELASGKATEIAGYRISASLASGLAGATLQPPEHARGVVWLDVSSSEIGRIFQTTVATLLQWQHAGVKTAYRQVCGTTFWQTAEIAAVPELQAATCEMLS